jgi:hypothetical protein
MKKMNDQNDREVISNQEEQSSMTLIVIGLSVIRTNFAY